jgi:two-component system, chemotaxis family, response regulator Rcp1
MRTSNIPIDILLVEDNPGDIRLIVETFKEAKFPYNLAIAYDGMKAIQILNNECKDAKRPKIIILDLNLPKKDGWEVLMEIKNDEKLKSIPVVILTSSTSKEDIKKSYYNHANAYLTKPLDLQQFSEVVKSIQTFWIKTAQLP